MNKLEDEKLGIKRETLILKGLCCASCAAKIEKKVKAMPEMSYAYLDFTTQKLIIETEVANNGLPHIIEKIQGIVDGIEQGVEVMLADNIKKEKTKNQDNFIRKKDILVIAGVIIFILLNILDAGKFRIYLFLVSYILIGYDILLQALKNIRNKEIFDENFLMVTATMGAFAIGEFPEAVAVMLFYKIGEYFQDRAVEKSRESISELMNIRPEYAVVERNKAEVRVSPEDVKKNETIFVRPGEKIPLDGEVIYGNTSIDTASLTGEALPKEISVGSKVIGGCINIDGFIKIKVEKEFREGTISKILEMVENSSAKKSKTEKFITKFARYYTPAVVFIAALIVFFPSVLFGWNNGTWLYRGLIFLVVSCPCALVISIPLSFFGGIGGASRRGILIKGGNFLEALNSVSTVVFDKTGTLTKGVFKLEKIITDSKYSQEELLGITAAAESFSNHPIAKAIIRGYQKTPDSQYITEYKELAGKGIIAVFKGKKIAIGNKKLMEENGIEVVKYEGSGTVLFVGIDKNYAGELIIKDEIREEAKRTIADLRNKGVEKIVMLTGDNSHNAEEIAKELNIDRYYAELLPADKIEKIEEIENNNNQGNVVFVGDGINDAPVLARAHIGIAMGGIGSDAAIEASDIVIMNDKLDKISEAIEIAKKTRKIVWQNITFALGVKGIVLVLGIFGIATMWEAVFADVGVALLAVLNAMRVLKIRK